VSADIAITAPLLMLILLTIVQFALWSHATHMAQAAAAEGLAVARIDTGTAADGETRALSAIEQLGGGPLREAAVHASRTQDQASVQVTGVAATVVPFLRLPVHAEAAGPVERFISDTTVDGSRP
jgi:Flp pilus assembly protein TadG